MGVFEKTERRDFVLFMPLKEAINIAVRDRVIEAGKGSAFGDLAGRLQEARPGRARKRRTNADAPHAHFRNVGNAKPEILQH